MIKIELEPQIAKELLIVLERRLFTIHEVEQRLQSAQFGTIEQEKEAIIPMIIALETALKIPPHQ
ncbi:hypothetical protein IY145_06540 [Methylosinus sp. H3A]|uniref:hypothetical protein n=1 Tax=Methylosinus sp. H3A TaxID=2785786 RepID=UPI0018C216E7|nr:hypothetical protein [Methylosinus sp. H3A]MBG0809030.1 hypothetical protein [Methylosinus sp. H3A]